MLASLSSDHKLGLGLVAGAFILFAVASAFLVPRYRPQYPGRDGLPLFIVVAGTLFVGMLFAVEFFGREPKEASAAKEGHTVPVTEVDYRIELADRNLSSGAYTFELQNKGKQPHNLTINGPGVNRAATPTIPGGSSAKLPVTLKRGEYEFYCSVPGHKQLGMDLKLTVS
jgi:plastocyanin